MWHSAKMQVKLMLRLIIEGLREVLTHQCCFPGKHVGAYSILFCILVYSTCPCPAIKAALGRGSDINLPFRPEENQRLVVHEYSGLEPGDTHGLGTVREFITKRTDPKCGPAERLHAVW
jgi:hypothetical protein